MVDGEHIAGADKDVPLPQDGHKNCEGMAKEREVVAACGFGVQMSTSLRCWAGVDMAAFQVEALRKAYIDKLLLGRR